MLNNIVFLQDSEYQVVNEIYYYNYLCGEFNTNLIVYNQEQANKEELPDDGTVYITFSDKKYEYKNVCRICYFNTKESNYVNFQEQSFSFHNFDIDLALTPEFFIPTIITMKPKVIYDQVQYRGFFNCAVHNNPNLAIFLSTLPIDLKTKINFIPIRSTTELASSIHEIDCYLRTSWNIDDYLLKKQCEMLGLFSADNKQQLINLVNLTLGKSRNKFRTLIEQDMNKKKYSLPTSLFSRFILEKMG